MPKRVGNIRRAPDRVGPEGFFPRSPDEEDRPGVRRGLAALLFELRPLELAGLTLSVCRLLIENHAAYYIQETWSYSTRYQLSTFINGKILILRYRKKSGG